MTLSAGVILAFALMINVKQCDMTLNIEQIDNFLANKVKCSQEKSKEISDAEFELLARCVEAEAGDQDYLGKCYVIDCILNRCDQWNQSIKETIYQKGQFAVVDNGRINTIKVSEETRQAIRDELRSRTNSEMLYFRMNHYHEWITQRDPSRNLFPHGDHYFSK